MGKLSIMIKAKTDKLNDIVKEIENTYEEDRKQTLLFSAAIILDDIKKLIKERPVVCYDTENEKSNE